MAAHGLLLMRTWRSYNVHRPVLNKRQWQIKNNSPQWNHLLLKLHFSVTFLVVRSACGCTQWGVTVKDGGWEGWWWRVWQRSWVGFKPTFLRHISCVTRRLLFVKFITIICARMRKFSFFWVTKSDHERIVIMYLQPLHWNLHMKQGNAKKVTLEFFFFFFLNFFFL